MSRSAAGAAPAPGLLPRLALGSLVAGFVLILLSPSGFLAPVVDVVASSALLLGAAALFLERSAGPAPALPRTLLALAPILALIVALASREPLTLECAATALRLAALALGGLTLRVLVTRFGLCAAGLRVLVAVSTLLCLFALAERCWIGEIARAALLEPDRPGDRPLAPEDMAFVRSTRPAATFVQANGFAGFLLLVLPLVAIALLRACRDGSVRRIAAPAALFAVHATAFGLARSRGAILALLVQASLLSALLALWAGAGGLDRLARILRALARATLLIAVAGGLLLALALAGLRIPFLTASFLATARLRLGYADAAVAMIRENFPRGLGLLGFRDAFPRYRAGGAGDAVHAHNSYLELIAEWGLPGLLIVLVAIAMLLRALSRPLEAQDPPAAHGVALRWTFGAALGSAFLAPILHPFTSFIAPVLPGAGPWLDALLLPALLALGLVATRSAPRFGSPPEPGLLRAAALTGLAGFALHSAVDFDASLEGVAAAAVLVATLCPPPGFPVASPRLSRRGTIPALAALIVLPAVLVPCSSVFDAALRSTRALPGLSGSDRPIGDRIRLRDAATVPHLPDPRLDLALARAAIREARFLDIADLASVTSRLEEQPEIAAGDAALSLLAARLAEMRFERLRPGEEAPRAEAALALRRAFDRALFVHPRHARLAFRAARFLRAEGDPRSAALAGVALRESSRAPRETDRLTEAERLEAEAWLRDP